MSVQVSVATVTSLDLLSILSTGLSPCDGIRECLHLDDKHHLAIQNVCFRGKDNPFSVAMLFRICFCCFSFKKNLQEEARERGCSLKMCLPHHTESCKCNG